jgi:hypothetical protein
VEEISQRGCEINDHIHVIEKKHLSTLLENMTGLLSRQNALEVVLRNTLPEGSARLAHFAKELQKLADEIDVKL